MHLGKSRFYAVALFLSLALVCVTSARHSNNQQDGNEVVELKKSITRIKRMLLQQDAINNNTISDEQVNKNDVGDRILLGEPYKSLVQTTARFALAQTKITQHVNLDTAMNFLNDAGYFLSKPKVLMRTVKAIAVTIATVLATVFFFPGAVQFLDAVWRNPMDTLNLDRYLTNGMSERSVIAVLGSKTDETLSRVGLQENSCRERSLCYLGEILKCSFPQTSDTITRFASDHFSNTGMRENIYARAFVSGFVDRNCSRIGVTDSQEVQSCLSNFISSIFVGDSRQKPK